MFQANRTRYGNTTDVAENHLKNDALIQWAIGRNPHVSHSEWNAMVDQWLLGSMTCIQEFNDVIDGRRQKRPWMFGIFSGSTRP